MIDRAVAEQWKQVRPAAHPRDELGVARLEDRRTSFTSTSATWTRYYLNDAVEKLNEFLIKTQDPKFAGEVVFQRRAPHCWGPSAPDLLQKMAAQIRKVAPAGADLTSWKYR